VASPARARPPADAGAHDGGPPGDLASAHADLLALAASPTPPDDPNAALWSFWKEAHAAALAHHGRGEAAEAAAAAALAFATPPLHDPGAAPPPDDHARLCLHGAAGDPCVPHLDVHLVPSSALVLTDLGYLLQRGGEHALAEELLAQTCRMFPDHMPAWANLGDALVSQGRVPDAYAAYQRHLDLRAARGLPQLDVSTLVDRALERAKRTAPDPQRAPAARPEPRASCGCASSPAGLPGSPLALLVIVALGRRVTGSRPRP
jgi:MYXO-CTERM domain-containing protein